MYITENTGLLDVAYILDIPPIRIGATWDQFRRRFYDDSGLTDIFELDGLTFESQIRYPGTDVRFQVPVARTVIANELQFSLPVAVTRQLTPGEVDWDVMARTINRVFPLAAGKLLVIDSATKTA